jgi:hypothetical protein
MVRLKSITANRCNHIHEACAALVSIQSDLLAALEVPIKRSGNVYIRGRHLEGSPPLMVSSKCFSLDFSRIRKPAPAMKENPRREPTYCFVTLWQNCLGQ